MLLHLSIVAKCLDSHSLLHGMEEMEGATRKGVGEDKAIDFLMKYCSFWLYVCT